MRVEVLLFGPMAERAGRASVAVDVAGGAVTVAGIRDELIRAQPELAQALIGCRLAVNHTFGSEETKIHPGDEVAVIGFVSGG